MERARILLAEDDQTTRAVLTEALAAEGYEVHTANDGQDGLQALERFSPDLVLTDLHMPRVDGFQMLRGIARLKPGLPVLVLTVSTNQMAETQARLLGALDVLQKPINLDALLNLVAQLLAPRLA